MQNLTYGFNNLEVTDKSCFNGLGGQLKIVIGVGSRDKRRKEKGKTNTDNFWEESFKKETKGGKKREKQIQTTFGGNLSIKIFQ